MAGGVNVKMGVSGVAQFKKGMKESQAAVKTLEAALKLNETAMKDNANQEQYLQNKTELLTQQLEAQKNVVHQAEQALRQMQQNGVDRTSTAFQQMQGQLYKAQTEMINIRNELEGVGEDGQTAEEGVSSMNAQLRKVGEGVSWQNVEEGIGKITDGLQNAARAAINLGKRIVEATLSGGQWADELQTAADTWEIDPEKLYRMRQASNRIDTDTDVILAAQQRLRRNLGKGDTGTMGAFAAIIGEGYNPQASGWEDAFWDAGKALMNFSDAEERESYANTLFGKSWNELIPLFKEGRKAYEDAMDSYTWIGDKQFESLKKVDDASQDLNSEWEALKLQFEATMADVMTPVMETLTGLLKEFNTYLQSDAGQDMLKKLGDAVSSLFSSLTEIDPEKAMEGVISLFNQITGALQWIIDNKEGVMTALKVIAGGFGLLKLTELAANIGLITSGLGGLGLMGGGAGAAGAAGAAAGGGSGLWGTLGKAGYLAVGLMMVAPTVQKLFDPKSWQQSETDKKIDAVVAATDMDAVKEANKEKGISNQDLMRTIFSRGTYTGGATDGMGISPGEGGGSSGGHGFGVAMDRMTEVAGETNTTLKAANQTNADLTGAVNGLNELPGTLGTSVTTAVENGLSGVTLVMTESAIDAIAQRVAGGMGLRVLAMTR